MKTTALIGILLGALSLGVVAADPDPFNAYAAYKSGEYEKAERMWRTLADDGNTASMNNLANLYVQGQGVKQSHAKAAEWYRRSAQAGDSVGQLNLGLAYEGGQGVEQDNQQAAKWFRKAAEQGDAEAQRNLGVMLATNYGEGLTASSPEQRDEAIRWLEKSADGGHPEAQGLLQALKSQRQ